MIEDYGVAEAAKEALIFALIGFLTVHGLPGAIASCTGARRATVLGSLAPGARPPAGRAGPDASRGAHAAVSDLLSIRGLRVGLRRRGRLSEIVRGVDLD